MTKDHAHSYTASKLADEIERLIKACGEAPDASKGGILLPWKLKAEGDLASFLNDQAANIVDALRAGPDRDAVIEECAKVCDKAEADFQAEAQQNWDRDFVKTGDELHQQAVASRYNAEAIRKLKGSRAATGEGS